LCTQHPAAVWLGGISYSLYLSHPLIKVYLRVLLDSHGYSEPFPAYAPALLALPALALAWALYICVEEVSVHCRMRSGALLRRRRR
jgi:peptidoglycan/LPS O-acetylase OafA/YrhL